MKAVYAKYTEDDLWLIKETVWERSLQNIRETQFALGNGYFACRGVLEEMPEDASPGTYIAGIYDRLTAQVDELVNFPNTFNFKFTANGEKLDVITMDVIKHRRILNLKKGLLIRHTLYQDSKKRRYDYQSIRFISMDNKNVGVMQIVLTPLDSECEIDIYTTIDTSVSNAGVLTEGRKRHFRDVELGQFKNAGYLVCETFEKERTIVYWSGFYYKVGGQKRIYAKDNIFRLKLKKGQIIQFTKIFYITHFPPSEDLKKHKEAAFKIFHRVFHSSFDSLVNKHVQAWEKLWEIADIVIGGAANLQINLRFNIYHLLICANSDNGFSSIGARTLTGEGYRGHIFWDAEIFVLPFYLFTFPEIAKNMLLYRYNRLDKAREIAKNNGYQGAMFPWESADIGKDETPTWAKDLDGSIVKIDTQKMEHHITADIAYAVHRYYEITEDKDFMEKYGYEILFETARFWASRSEFNSSKNKYEIKHVIGPDEFHIDVNNNAYTNLMAKGDLFTAYKFYIMLKKNLPIYLQIKKKLNLDFEEVKQWRKISTLMTVNVTDKNIIEQFDGYFKLKKILLNKTDENGIPIFSRRLKTKNLNKTQLVKQADVLIALYLLPDLFSLDMKKLNYEFYINRTLHKSSLSVSIHSIVACECGDLYRAHNLFNVSLKADISDYYGNTQEGIHAASLGGTWQAILFGFAGISIKRDMLYIIPKIPESWNKITFCLKWRGDLLKIEMTNQTVKIRLISYESKKKVKVRVFSKVHTIEPQEKYEFKGKISKAIEKAYHY